jgi:hypothetical protein
VLDAGADGVTGLGAADFFENPRSAIAINLVLRDRQAPPNQNEILEVVLLAKDPASGGSM